EDATRRIQNLSSEIDALEREQVTGAGHDDRIADLQTKRKDTEADLDRLNEQWTKEKELTGQIRNIRLKLEMSRLDGKIASTNGSNGTAKAAAGNGTSTAEAPAEMVGSAEGTAVEATG